MAFSKKNKRRITVEGQQYFWSVSGNDDFINLYVMVDVSGGQKLNCYFRYHQDETPHKDGVSLSNQFVITTYIVRQVIEYGLKNGWEPLAKGPELRLGHLDQEIDLRLEQNKEYAIKGIQQNI